MIFESKLLKFDYNQILLGNLSINKFNKKKTENFCKFFTKKRKVSDNHMKSVDNQTECAKQNKNLHQSSNYKLSKMIKNLSKLVNITPNIMKLDIYFIRTIFLHFLIYFFLHFTSFIFRISHTLYSKLATMMGK